MVAISVITVVDGKLAMDESAMDRVLGNVLRKKLCVISIVGPMRSGKSFFMTQALRHFSGGTGEFLWSRGYAPVTNGIWIWDELIEYGDRQILLVDSQGLFDGTMNQHTTTAIFGICALMSSHVIYNVDKRIQEDQLQMLGLFSEYGASVCRSRCAETVKPIAPFQSLDFLVRDWGGDTDEADTYFKAFMSTEDRTPEVVMTRTHLLSCYNRVGCRLFPHPGLIVSGSEFDGDLGMLRGEFVHELRKYIEEIGTKSQPKCIDGVDIGGAEFVAYVKTCVDIFNDSDAVPDAKSLMHATIEAVQHSARSQAIDTWKAIALTKRGGLRTRKLGVARDAAVESLSRIANFGNSVHPTLTLPRSILLLDASIEQEKRLASTKRFALSTLHLELLTMLVNHVLVKHPKSSDAIAKALPSVVDKLETMFNDLR